MRRSTPVQSVPMDTRLTDGQRKNAPSPTVTSLEGKMTVCNCWQPSKANAPIAVSPDGMTMPSKRSALQNALSAMPVTRYVRLPLTTRAGISTMPLTALGFEASAALPSKVTATWLWMLSVTAK
ncbi:MAG: hypothetical protein Q4E55_06360 [Bacteroidales bacterium]|nr:hypothetical protein [Bacteroidales bacterium]